MAKCRGDGREPPQRMQRCRHGPVVLSSRRVLSYKASSLITPGASLPPLEALALPPREAYQGILGYENHPIYDYLARSQAQNWPYHLVSQYRRVLVIQQDTFRLTLALRSQRDTVRV